MIYILVITVVVLGLPALLLITAILADLAGEAEWLDVQRAWDAYSPSATGALHREVMDRSAHLL